MEAIRDTIPSRPGPKPGTKQARPRKRMAEMEGAELLAADMRRASRRESTWGLANYIWPKTLTTPMHVLVRSANLAGVTVPRCCCASFVLSDRFALGGKSWETYRRHLGSPKIHPGCKEGEPFQTFLPILGRFFRGVADGRELEARFRALFGIPQDHRVPEEKEASISEVETEEEEEEEPVPNTPEVSSEQQELERLRQENAVLRKENAVLRQAMVDLLAARS